MLISAELLQAYNGIIQDSDDEVQKELLNIHIGTAEQIINDYVGFEIETIVDDEEYTAVQIAIFKNVELRIATLLQLENNSNIGVNSNAEMGVSRSYLNVVDYTPYLKPLSAFRKVGSI